jgi:hypothetical protein
MQELDITSKKSHSAKILCDPVHISATGGYLYSFHGLSQFADRRRRKTDMDWDSNDEPLSASNVSLRLAAIQKRCSDLLTEPDSLDELQLEGEETAPGDQDGFNPYNHG